MKVVLEFDAKDDPVQAAYFVEEIKDALRERSINAELGDKTKKQVSDLTKNSSEALSDLVSEIKVTLRKV